MTRLQNLLVNRDVVEDAMVVGLGAAAQAHVLSIIML